jgi:thioredoxin-like negative regulator of GroEL
MSMDRMEQAEGLLKHALQLDPTSAVAHFRLSTVYRQMGRPEDAKHEIEEYQKYKKMKEQLQEIYHQMRLASAAKANDESDPRK